MVSPMIMRLPASSEQGLTKSDLEYEANNRPVASTPLVLTSQCADSDKKVKRARLDRHGDYHIPPNPNADQLHLILSLCGVWWGDP